MTSTIIAGRLQSLSDHLQGQSHNMSHEPVITEVQAGQPVPVDNELRGRLVLVTGASGG